MSRKSAVMFGPKSSTILRTGQKSEQASFNDLSQASQHTEGVSKPPMSKTKSMFSNRSENYVRGIECNCGPDLYNRVLGPTADETFLNGLHTVLNLFGRFTTCEREPATTSVPQVISQVLESIGLPREMVSQILQTSFEALEEEKPELVSRILQTSTPEMISKILSTVGLEPDMVSQIIQTLSLEELKPKPEMIEGEMQTSPSGSLHSISMQTSDHDVKSSCVCCQCSPPETDDLSLPIENSDVSKIIDDELRSGDHIIEKPKMYICCPKERKENQEVLCPVEIKEKVCICCPTERRENQEIVCPVEKKEIICLAKRKEMVPCPRQKMKCKCETRQVKSKCEKISLCRCYECCTPVIFKTNRNYQDCLCLRSKSKCKCYNSKGEVENNNGSNYVMANGDTSGFSCGNVMLLQKGKDIL